MNEIIFGVFALLLSGYLLGKGIEFMIEAIKEYNELFREERRKRKGLNTTYHSLFI